MNISENARVLKDILEMSSEPVGVKFLEEKQPLDGFETPKPSRYCQMLMEARKGKSLLLTSENITCPASAWAFGLKEPPEMLRSGAMLANMGIFGSAEAGKNTLSTMSRLEMGKYKAVACYPLINASLIPDVVIIESSVEHLMWVALARTFKTGGRLDFSTAILEATCVDSTVIPFLYQKLNASLGCYGCREATDLAMSECLLGFPIKDLDEIVNSLLILKQKTIARVRDKSVFKAYSER